MLFKLVTPRQNAVYELWLIHVGIGPSLVLNFFSFFTLRDVPGVEVLMEQHQNRKVEIDAREDSFDDVVKMGKDLIARNHYATPEVKNYHDLKIRLSHI